MGWLARGATAAPSVFQTLTVDAIEAHRLYVVEVRHPVEVPGNERKPSAAMADQALRLGRPRARTGGSRIEAGRRTAVAGLHRPASFMMYESATGERFTIYTAKSDAEATQMRFAGRGQGKARCSGPMTASFTP